VSEHIHLTFNPPLIALCEFVSFGCPDPLSGFRIPHSAFGWRFLHSSFCLLHFPSGGWFSFDPYRLVLTGR
jgi:hypothetical protein